MNADTRSVRTMSTIIDDVDKPDEADETSSFRSMSSTTSTNYGAPKPRPSATPLYTIPDEAAASEDGDEQESSGQSETEAAQDLPASAAAQALHQEADELILSSQHASSSADSLADGSTDPLENKGLAPGKSLGSNESFSGTSELSPVSEAESPGRTTSNGEHDERSLEGEKNLPSASAIEEDLPALVTDQALSAADASSSGVSASISSAQTGADPLTEGGTNLEDVMLNSDSMHTPRAMGPPATPGAPLVPKIDAGPAPDPPVEDERFLATAEQADQDVSSEEQTLFAGLNMM